MDDQSLNRHRRPLCRIIRVVEQVTREQGSGVAEERDQRPGDDHGRVVEGGDQKDRCRGGYYRDDPHHIDVRHPVRSIVIRPRCAAVSEQGADSRGDCRCRNTPEERVRRLGQGKRVRGRASVA